MKIFTDEQRAALRQEWSDKEARMVMAHKQGRKKAQLGHNRDYVVDLARLLPTDDERVAFIAGYEGEKHRMERAALIEHGAQVAKRRV